MGFKSISLIRPYSPDSTKIQLKKSVARHQRKNYRTATRQARRTPVQQKELVIVVQDLFYFLTIPTKADRHGIHSEMLFGTF